jgi:methionine synthase II (cobalamin-independent)
MSPNKVNPSSRVDQVSPAPTRQTNVTQVGSWLRPADVLETYDSRRLDPSPANAVRCREIEDHAIAALVRRQLGLGLRSITDGEFRRAMFFAQFVEGLEGGEQTYIPEFKFFVPITTGRLRWKGSIMVEDWRFVQEEIERMGKGGIATAKTVIPSPTMLHYGGATNTGQWINLTTYMLANRGPKEGFTAAYKDDEEFFQDLIQIYRSELTALHAAGCRHVQFDDTVLAFLADPGQREIIEKAGDYTAETLFDKYIWYPPVSTALTRLFNECINFPGREDMTLVCHLCKGNYNSQFFLEGGTPEGYEPIAKRLFNDMNQDGYFMVSHPARQLNIGMG